MKTSDTLLFLVIVYSIISVIIYSILNIVKNKIVQKDNIESSNLAFSIWIGSIIFSLIYILTGVNEPILSSIKVLEQNSTLDIKVEIFKIASIFLFISIAVCFTMILFSSILYRVLFNQAKILAEIKYGNIGASIFFSIVLFSQTILLKEYISLIFESFIPFPEGGIFIR